jgi:hypothetical protein
MQLAFSGASLIETSPQRFVFANLNWALSPRRKTFRA